MTTPGEHRATGRVLLSNQAGQYLFLLTHFDPEVGLPPRWITPGGGIDVGETAIDTAARELFEETGLKVSLQALGEQVAEFSGRWDWVDGKNFHTYTDHFYEYQVGDFTMDKSRWTPEEHRDVLQIKWWSVSELENSSELFAPHGLVTYITSR